MKPNLKSHLKTHQKPHLKPHQSSRNKLRPFGVICLAMFLLNACSLKDATGEMFNVLSVKFSEASPAVDGQTVNYSGGLLDVPSLDKFKFKMVFHVKADNSGNTGKAAFGSDVLKPILNLHINSKSNRAISTSIPAFSVAGGAITDLSFPIEIPFSLIDGALAKKIINGDPIPYFLSGTLTFDLLDGSSILGSGKSNLDLTSGEISTRPSASVSAQLLKLL